jgi:hypothetical protein
VGSFDVSVGAILVKLSVSELKSISFALPFPLSFPLSNLSSPNNPMLNKALFILDVNIDVIKFTKY